MNFILPKLIFKVEKWKWNKEYRVYVSNTGKVKNSHKKLLPFRITQDGYVQVKTPNGHTSVHRIVMKTFCPTEDMDNLTVDHLDHNKRNNNVDNLEWVTQKENQLRAIRDHLQSDTTEEYFFNRRISYPKEKRIFANIDEVTDFMMGQKGMSANTKRETVRKNLKKAILANKTYGGFYFTTNIYE